jgi:uncharacterized protein (TIGR03437 family)
VDVAPAQPTIFVSNGNAIVYVSREGGPLFLVSPASPAQAGDKLAIYCAGLGATDPPAADGAVSVPPARTKDPAVTVMIGGREARVLSTAYPAEAITDSTGYVPGLVGVYEVDVEMPSGVPPGDGVPVILSISGQTSPAAIVAVR